MDKENKDTQLVVKLSQDEKKKFKDYCDKEGYTISKRVLSLIRRDMNGEIK